MLESKTAVQHLYIILNYYFFFLSHFVVNPKGYYRIYEKLNVEPVENVFVVYMVTCLRYKTEIEVDLDWPYALDTQTLKIA